MKGVEFDENLHLVLNDLSFLSLIPVFSEGAMKAIFSVFFCVEVNICLELDST